jgi:hypothetical protein
MSRNGEAAMLTKHPHIIYALPPKRISKKRERVEHPNMPVTVQALSPQHIERKQRAAALAAKVSRLVGARKPSPFDEIDHEKAGEAADRLWQEIVQAVNAQRDQPAPVGPNKRRTG